MINYLEKFNDFICAILESNPILDHITRLGMSDEGYFLAMVKASQNKQNGKGITAAASRRPLGGPAKE